MKSKLFESIRDRQNIIDAYSKMVNEATEENQLLKSDSEIVNPVAIYDENHEDKWISLDDFIAEKEADVREDYDEIGSDGYYFMTAVNELGTEKIYEKLKTETIPSFVPGEEDIARSGILNSESDLFDEIVSYGKEYVDSLHYNDIEVSIPDWAASYIENGDASSLSDEDKRMVDEYLDSINDDGYDLVYDGENLGFKSHPEFGLASDCIKYYLIKKETNESVENDSFLAVLDDSGDYSQDQMNAIRIINKEFPVDAAIIASVVDEFDEETLKRFLSNPKRYFNEIKDRIDDIENDYRFSFGETDESEDADSNISNDRWFDEHGSLIKEIPDEAIADCSQAMGHDNEEDCRMWVNKLGFDKNLDMSLAKGYLKSTGGWTPEEIKAMTDEEVAIRLLWLICCDLKENGKDYPIYIADGGRFDESTVNEYTYHSYEVVITNIGWKDEDRETAEEKDYSLPSRDKMCVEVSDGEDVDDAIKGIYIDSFGFAPESFRIVKQRDLGVRNDGVEAKRVDDVTNQKEVDKILKENPSSKMISEENGDDVGNIDSDYDEDGIYHEFPKTDNKINSYRQKFRVHPDGSSKFDDLAEELHTALDGCTKGFFTDNQYSVVQEVLKRLESIGLFTTITKIQNYGTRGSDGLRQGKRYFFDASWTNKFGKRMIIHGIIIIAFAGTVDNPEERYDACVNFFTDDGNFIRVNC